MIDRNDMVRKHIGDFSAKTWNQVQRDESISILMDIHRVLYERNIPFWIFFGTLLGIYRDGNVIDWDNDCDIAMLSEDFDSLVKCEESFKEIGCEEFGAEGKECVTIFRNHGHCDIYFFKDKDKEDKRKCHHGIRLPKNTFSGTDVIEWNGRDWRLVNNVEKCLRIVYGEDWEIPSKDFRHVYTKEVRE